MIGSFSLSEATPWNDANPSCLQKLHGVVKVGFHIQRLKYADYSYTPRDNASITLAFHKLIQKIVVDNVECIITRNQVCLLLRPQCFLYLLLAYSGLGLQPSSLAATKL